MNTRLIALFGAMLSAAAVAPSAHASVLRIDDTGESLTLYVDGIAHNSNGGNVSNFNLNNSYTSTGERMQFDWQNLNFVSISDGVTSGLNPVYTRLLGNAEDAPFPLSDEFLISYLGAGTFHVDFISDDTMLPGAMPGLHPTLNLTPSALTALERPGYQDVAYLMGSISVQDTFQVASVPEPSQVLSGALVLLGAGGILVGRYLRRRA